MVLKLSDIQVGTPTIPRQWSNKEQKNVEYDFKEAFIQGVMASNHKKSGIDYRAYLENLKKIKVESNTIETGSKYYHQNYLTYLEKCWGDHLGIVITPDIIWYTILAEFAAIVKGNPETYRSLFTDSIDKKEITVTSGSLSVMPLDSLASALRNVVPSDTSLYCPNLGFTKNSSHAFLAAFCDTCSPYYNYSMLLCGFPFIDIKGDIEAWKLLKDSWLKLKAIVQGNDSWVMNVDNILNGILANYNSPDFWKSIFSLKKCGSGHQTELSGWYTDLFAVQPKVRYAENFSSHVSNIKYKQLDTNQNLEMSVGLFNSIQKDEFMEPSFAFIVYNITDYL